MNNESLYRTLKSVAMSVLEDAAFVFSDELPGTARPSIDDWNPAGVSLSFTGETSGVFRLWADEALLPVLAANMLGLEPGSADARDKGADALREMVNIILGNFLTDHFGSEAVFDLGLPSPADPARAMADCSGDSGVWLQVEGSAVLAILDVNHPRAPDPSGKAA
jgi:hypothetical protein